jgi:hypothetical protein
MRPEISMISPIRERERERYPGLGSTVSPNREVSQAFSMRKGSDFVMQIKISELTRVAVCLYYLNHWKNELIKTARRIPQYSNKG